jgi:hypothetical protein
MARQFIGVQAVGSANDILHRVQSWVRLLRCGHVIPILHFEKRARGNYYVFLGIEMEPGARMPEEVAQVCDRAGLTGQRIGPLAFEQIRGMLDPQEFDTSGNDRIPYRSRWVHDPGDIIDLADSGAMAAPDPELTSRFDHLLTWLSSAGEGRRETFLRACQALGVAGDAASARSVFRRFSLLGHVEASSDAREWVICPPVFVRPPICPTRCFWCGQRTDQWLERLRGMGAILPEHQPGSMAPARVSFDLSDSLRNALAADPEASRFEWQEQPLSDVLANHLPDLDGWQQSLQPIVGLTNPRAVERWEGQAYVEDTSFYIRDGRYHGQPGLYCVTRDEGRHQSRLMFYFDENGQRLLRGDWYGLRFLALRSAGHRCDALWQGQNGHGSTLVLRASERWPMIYERALVLSSGLLPEQPSGSSLLRYRDVPHSTAQALAGKLGVELEVHTDA